MRLESYIDMSNRKPFRYYWENSRWPKTKKFVYDFPLATALAFQVKTVLLPLDRMTMAYYVNQLRDNNKANLGEFIYNKGEGFRPLRNQLFFTYTRYVWTNALAFSINENTQERWLYSVVDPHSSEYRARTLLAGGIAGFFTHMMAHYMEVARLGMIPDLASKRNFYTTNRSVMKYHFHEWGVAGLYRTFWWSLMGTFIYRALYFGGWEIIKTEKFQQAQRPSLLTIYLHSQLLATGAALITHPFDPIRRRIIYQDYIWNKKHYDGVFDCFRKTVSFRGWKQIFNSAHVTATRSIGSGMMLAAFDYYKREIETPSPDLIM